MSKIVAEHMDNDLFQVLDSGNPRGFEDAQCCCAVDEGRKRVVGIIAGILVARHLKTTDDPFEIRSGPRTESVVAAAVQWAEKIMRKVDNLAGASK